MRTPIKALITTDDGEELTFDYFIDGTFNYTEYSNNDLMMITEKKKGWVVLYYIFNSNYVSEVIAIKQIEWEE